MHEFTDLIAHLQQQSGQNLQGCRLQAIDGGDISTAYRLQNASVDWFIKLNTAARQDMFAAEAASLQALAECGCIRVPKVIAFGSFHQHAYLLLDYIELRGLSNNGASTLGRQLAALHAQPQAYFGWQRDNTIGLTPQTNPRYHDWPSFWREQRLGKQLQLAAANGYHGKLQDLGARLSAELNAFFSNYQPQASLLHGDLWGGNAALDANGLPVIFDPACYYGDRETDLAMTELFGGFNREFYAAYQAEFGLDNGYKARKDLYNLYHILNHLNLFGGGYAAQAQNMMMRLLAELG